MKIQKVKNFNQKLLAVLESNNEIVFKFISSK
jgi:hypothetical protein